MNACQGKWPLAGELEVVGEALAGHFMNMGYTCGFWGLLCLPPSPGLGKKQVWRGHQPSLSGPGLAPELADPKLVSEQGVSFPSIRPVAWLLMLSGHSALGPAIYLGIVNILRCRARGSMTRL